MKKAALLLLFMTLLLSACAPAAQEPAEPSALPAASVAASEAAPEEIVRGDSAIQVTGALGRELTFDSPPQRIVVAGRATPLLADAVYLFPEAQERIVAIEARFQLRNDPFYPFIDPDFDGVSLLEMNASAEQILPTNPEIVIRIMTRSIRRWLNPSRIAGLW